MHRFFLLIFLPVLLFAQSHLLVTEVFVPPSSQADQAFVEIANESEQAIDLTQRYLANYNTYYELVNNQFPVTSQFFVAKFPSVTIQPGEVKVVALDGAGYLNAFGKHADFEIKGTDDQTQDMNIIRMGDNPSLETLKGMLVVFQWDGQSDLVKDVDYIPWGLTAFNSVWMDKSGVQIDGPDADSQTSAYADDLNKSQQKAITSIPSGESLQRVGTDEIDEITTDGNGITGHNEATENWKESFKTATPTPGSFSAVAGDGTGTASIEPDTVNVNETKDFVLSFSTEESYELTKIQIDVPQEFSWAQQASDVVLQGTAFTSAQVEINQNTISIQNAALNAQQSGTVTIKNVKAASEAGKFAFQVQTATANGNLTPIAIFPAVTVIKKLTIADIQENVSEYEGKQVTIEAVVTVGVNVLRNDRTSAYVQDESGRGINLSDQSLDHPELKRGNRLRITGTVSDYTGKYNDVTTQIENFTLTVLSTGNSVPAVPTLTCAAAGNLDLEGTFVETGGIIIDKAEGIGGGTNMTIDDGSGALTLRIWDTAGLDLSGFNQGDTIKVRGVVSSYRLAPQLLVCYQQDIMKSSLPKTVAGTGEVTVQPDSVGKGETVSLTFTVKGTLPDTLSKLSLTVPNEWSWTGDAGDVQLEGAFADISPGVNGRTISLDGFVLTNANSGQITVSNLQSPQMDTASVFVVKTAPEGGILAPIASSPAVMVGKGTSRMFISIKEARNKPIGSTVTVKGVVTIGAGILRTNFTDAYMQDESGYGINIYQPGGLDARIKRGNLVMITGSLKEYQGKMELEEKDVIVLRTNQPIPAVREISTFDASRGLYEGSFVQVKGLIKGISAAGGGTTLYIDDGSGEVGVRVWDTAGLDLSDYEIGDYIIVRGVASLYNNAGQILLGYQEDIIPVEAMEGQVSLKVPAKPFVPDEGEKLPIEYSAGTVHSHVTLRLFDLSGRMVTTLFDGTGLPFPITKEWDGRDQLGQLVPLGTYICHLEVVNNNTGKRTVKIAPIVVGTILK